VSLHNSVESKFAYTIIATSFSKIVLKPGKSQVRFAACKA